MNKEAYQKYISYCSPHNINIYFEYKNSIVFSTQNKHTSPRGMNPTLCRELVIISKCDIEPYSSASEINRKCRGDLLAIQDIISFFTGSPLTVYDNFESSFSCQPIKYEKRDIYLSIDGIEHTDELLILLGRIEEEPELIITLLDKWRKAIYLQQESSDSDLYYDEAILNFFHILELLADSVTRELKSNLDKRINKFLLDYFELFYFTTSKIEQKAQENKNILKSVLVNDHLSLGVKVKYFLDKYNILDDNISFFIDNIIEVRNMIAHGRISYQNKFLFPLPPFFTLARNSYTQIDTLYFLTAQMISKYVGINCWEDEWNKTKTYIMPHKNKINAFLNDSNIIATNDTLQDNNGQNITWQIIFSHYVKNPKKNILVSIESKVRDCFLTAEVNEKTGGDLFNISILLADSDDGQIKSKAIENIKIVIKKHWYCWSNFKDAHVYLAFYNVPITWFGTFLENREYLDCDTKNSNFHSVR